MKRIIKMMIIILIVCIMLICVYCFGTTQAKTEIETVTEVKTVDKIIEVVPNGYINTETDNFINNYVNMNKVVDFVVTDNSLYLILNDGNGYYWER